MVARGLKTFIFLFISTIAYALNGILEYLLIRNVNIYNFFFLWSIGGVVSVPLVLRGLGARSDLYLGIKNNYPSLFGGGLLVAFNVSLFLAFKSFLLAEVYPLIALSSLIFFLIDLLVFGKSLSKLSVMIVLSGIIAVIMGVYYAGGGTEDFSISLLPFVIAIALLAGAGYYLVFYNVRVYSIGSKITSMAVLSIIASTALFLLRGTFEFAPLPSLLIAATGALYVVAVAMELEAVRINEHLALGKDVAMKNFINNFTFLDTVIVLLGSIAIGSYTVFELLGGSMIVVGVVLISFARRL